MNTGAELAEKKVSGTPDFTSAAGKVNDRQGTTMQIIDVQGNTDQWIFDLSRTFFLPEMLSEGYFGYQGTRVKL